ncbi:MAG: hypothetical protein JWM31_839 [Solirubrobacterales bacterium]|nr:hypothetical protein [Solirubrobacterales bacterium]
MKPYAMPELVSAAWQMKRRVGFSPTLWEYGMWSAARRQVTRRAGEQERLPSIPVVYRLCRKHNADWPQVSEAASAWGLRGEMRWV